MLPLLGLDPSPQSMVAPAGAEASPLTVASVRVPVEAPSTASSGGTLTGKVNGNLATKASSIREPPLLPWNAPAVVGKLPLPVWPTTHASPNGPKATALA